MIQLNGTFATKMRDELIIKRGNKEITLKGITDRLVEIKTPKWFDSQILQMVQYRVNDRCTCPVEQAMAGAVYSKIVDELMKQENN